MIHLTGIRLCSPSGTRPVLALHLDLIPSRLDRLVYPSRQLAEEPPPLDTKSFPHSFQLLDSSLVRQSSTNFSALHSSQNPRPTICLIAAVPQGLLRINTGLTPSKL
ncbi:hypothetical protein PGTUg99_028557 [Puccinia graminis f. sp. tritici]|uniref:Uncharacterized protein n=1 Tax=Puccinia graminis f. sp. tritici TaxID=56615 RepID=A0A5B0PNY3_PUCGR|nr:hypothetical protein PGTUg99_028557 [Puccinia graminis f. sp. tritici]